MYILHLSWILPILCSFLLLKLLFLTIHSLISSKKIVIYEKYIFFSIYKTTISTRTTAGTSFTKYAISHAGLGIWDTTTDEKFTTEFISNNYVGALLPTTHESSGMLSWENAASVVFTTPTENSDWLNSQLVCTTTGALYSQLIDYIKDNIALFETFQPVEVIYINASSVNTSSSNSYTYSSDAMSNSGDIKVAPKDSFWFVHTLLTQLGDYGCDIEGFLQIYATSYQYISRYDEVASIVSWEDNGAANTDVFQW